MAFPPKKTPPGSNSLSPEPSESKEPSASVSASGSESTMSTDNALAAWAKKKRGEK